MNTECLREMVSYWADGMSFRVLLCVEGCGSLLIEEEEEEKRGTLFIFKGSISCILLITKKQLRIT